MAPEYPERKITLDGVTLWRCTTETLQEDKVVSKRSIIGKLATLGGKSRHPLSYGACRLIMLVWSRSLNCAFYSGFLN